MEAGFYISKTDWDKVLNYAKASVQLNSNAEIGGMMIMQKDKDGDYVLKHPVILKQVVSSGNCVLDAEELALYYGKAYKKHKKNGLVRYVWWHSHAKMKAFWSGTDDATILKSESEDFTVSLVVNVAGEYKLRVQYFHPILLDEDVELTVMNGKTATIPKAILNEVKDKTSLSNTTWRANKKGKVKDLWENQQQEQMNFGDAYGYSYGNYDGYGQYHRETYSPDGKEGFVGYQTLVEYMDGLNSQYCAGEIKYEAWKRAVEGTNDQLKDRKCLHKLEVLTEEALDEVVFNVHANLFVIGVNK